MGVAAGMGTLCLNIEVWERGEQVEMFLLFLFCVLLSLLLPLFLVVAKLAVQGLNIFLILNCKIKPIWLTI